MVSLLLATIGLQRGLEMRGQGVHDLLRHCGKLAWAGQQSDTTEDDRRVKVICRI